MVVARAEKVFVPAEDAVKVYVFFLLSTEVEVRWVPAGESMAIAVKVSPVPAEKVAEMVAGSPILREESLVVMVAVGIRGGEMAREAGQVAFTPAEFQTVPV